MLWQAFMYFRHTDLSLEKQPILRGKCCGSSEGEAIRSEGTIHSNCGFCSGRDADPRGLYETIQNGLSM
jgi:hypothetical protein